MSAIQLLDLSELDAHMLSRVAESIYWMSRYVERAENVARFIDVNLQLMLDDPSGEGQQWLPLVNTTGDHEEFEKRYGKATQQNVIHFLTFDAENPNSILSCVRAARENAPHRSRDHLLRDVAPVKQILPDGERSRRGQLARARQSPRVLHRRQERQSSFQRHHPQPR